MNRFPFFIIVFVITSLSFTSCDRGNSEDVNQDKIWTNYEVFYNANEDKTYARATFRFNSAVGTLLELGEEAVVIFNGESLTFKPVLAYYEKDYAGWLDGGDFVYSDIDANTFPNTISGIKTIDFPIIESVSKSAAYELTWVGEPLNEGESVVVTIDGEKEGDARIFTQNNVGSTSIILDKDKLEQLNVGATDFYMERMVTYEVQTGTSVGGNIVGRYRTENVMIEVVE